MINGSETQHRTVRLFVRADPELGCEKQKQAVLDRLEGLDADDRIDDYEVNVWTKAIRIAGPLEGTTYYQRVFDHFTAFQQWAVKESVALKSAFNVEEVNCEITDETYRVLSLPCLCLAVYEDDELRGVYPHTDDETTRTINHCLDRLEASSQIEYAD
ncbi:HTH domain-containing protein [Halohasta litorea]|uniref:HTH domain-containing protein n=1 Tax=Halohasta litorea TaxID=869891 RepID=A0ABD6DA97_9EURY|nr:HTH domain-containing protein [Halohasta litorea]